MRTIAVLGATGSIGTQALDVARGHKDLFHVAVMTARSDADALFALAREFRPEAIGLVKEPAYIPEDIRRGTALFFGEDCSERALAAVKPDDALAAVVGVAGLGAVMAALSACKRVLLANKEALVTGGALVTEKARRHGVPLLPVDSEHSAIFQCLQGRAGNEPERLLLTASGGPFRTWKKEDIARASVRDALGHPTWRMGAKITVDCATLMNKGLEVIEAKYLFAVPPEKIEAVVHPESIVHSCVEYKDGAVLAQMGLPDMRGAIGYAMGYPDRVPFGGRRLKLEEIGRLTFEPLDQDKFPCYRLARQALQEGGAAPIWLNGANEEAVAAFLQEKISFGGIAETVDGAMQRALAAPVRDVDDVLAADAAARRIAREIISRGI